MATFKVTTPDGKAVELEIYTPDQLTAFVNRKQKDPKALQASVTYIKALGRKVSEISSMDEAERKAFILERYKELGVGNAKTAKGAAKPAAAAPGKPKGAAKAKEPEPDDDDDDDDDKSTETEEESEETTTSSADVAALRIELSAVNEKFDELTRFVLETHALVRQIAPAATGFSEEELVAFGQENYATLVGIQAESDAGNDD
jgi:hypothetical protein